MWVKFFFLKTNKRKFYTNGTLWNVEVPMIGYEDLPRVKMCILKYSPPKSTKIYTQKVTQVFYDIGSKQI